MMQFITALEKTAAACNYSKSNRFDSFAPMRLNVAAQWLVDGVHSFPFVLAPWSGPFFEKLLISRFIQRDYFWNLSRAILLAKESIYIHDWWLSPGKLSSEQGFRHIEV